MNKTKIVEVIYTTKQTGTGKTNDPVRLIEQLWTKDGILIAQEGSEDGDTLCEWLSEVLD